MAVRFRNVDADPSDPVETWPYEGLVAAIERGTLNDWVRITKAIDRDPWGPTTQRVEEYLTYESPWGVGPLLQRAITRARAQATEREKREVAKQVSRLIERSGLSMAEFAGRIGTSRSRLSTYRSGSVTPSAALLHRMQRLVDRRREQGQQPEGSPGSTTSDSGSKNERRF